MPKRGRGQTPADAKDDGSDGDGCDVRLDGDEAGEPDLKRPASDSVGTPSDLDDDGQEEVDDEDSLQQAPVSVPPSRLAPLFVDPNTELAKLPMYYKNIKFSDLKFESTEIKEKGAAAGKDWSHITHTPTDTNQLIIWTPFCTVEYARFFPFGNRIEDYPKEKFASLAIKTHKYTAQLSSNPSWDSRLENELGQDKHMADFAVFLKSLTAWMGNHVFNNKSAGAEVRAKALETLKIARPNDKISKAELRAHFMERHLQAPVKLRLESLTDEEKKSAAEMAAEAMFKGAQEDDDDAEVETVSKRPSRPNTEYVPVSTKVFKQAYSFKDKKKLEKLSTTNEVIAQAASDGFLMNDVKFYIAGEQKFDRDGMMISEPFERRKLEDGDVCAMQLKVVPVPYVGNTGKCHLSLQPVGVMWLRKSTRNLQQAEVRAIPTQPMMFSSSVATPYSV